MVFANFLGGFCVEDIRFDINPDTKIENISYVSVLRNENYVFEYKNGKEKHSFIYVQSGMLDYFFPNDQKQYTVNAGSVIFIPCALPYKAIYRKNGTVIKIITFDTSCVQAASFFSAPSAELSQDCADIFGQITEKNMRNTLFLTSAVYMLMYRLQQEAYPVDKKYKKILPAIKELDRRFYKNEKTAFYANMCGMCESNFRRLFKEYTGKSVIEYRNSIRIAEVKKMLGSGEFTVAQAAYEAGFNNMSFFYSVYNKKRQ